MSRALLEVEGLKVHFPVTSGLLRRTTGYVKAVDGISFRSEAERLLGSSASRDQGRRPRAEPYSA